MTGGGSTAARLRVSTTGSGCALPSFSFLGLRSPDWHSHGYAHEQLELNTTNTLVRLERTAGQERWLLLVLLCHVHDKQNTSNYWCCAAHVGLVDVVIGVLLPVRRRVVQQMPLLPVQRLQLRLQLTDNCG